ncbi:MAG TPA: hypothetical protein PLP59_11805 [Thermotogota bacterium]|nr:hypothetical protein [Thermotogota bacterium]
MPRKTRYTQEHEEAVVTARKEGKSYNEIQKEIDISRSKIAEIVKRYGLQSDRSATKKATETLIDRTHNKALELAYIFLCKFKKMVSGQELPAKDYQHITTSYGIVIDKLQLLKGAPTAITKNENTNSDWVKLDPKDFELDELRKIANAIRSKPEGV